MSILTGNRQFNSQFNSQSVSQSVSQPVSQSVSQSVQQSVALESHMYLEEIKMQLAQTPITKPKQLYQYFCGNNK